jgi:hypothetical protein
MHSAPQNAKDTHFRAIVSMTPLKMARFPLRQWLTWHSGRAFGGAPRCKPCLHVRRARVYWLQTRLGEGRREIRIESYPSASSLQGEHGA